MAAEQTQPQQQQQQHEPWFCTVEFHDDDFSTASVVLNTDRLPIDTPLTPGKLARVLPLKGNVRPEDIRPNNGGPTSPDTPAETPSTGERPTRTWPRSRYRIGLPRGERLAEHIDSNKSIVFVVAPMTQGQRSRRPHLQCSLHMSARRAFGFSNRQQVVILPSDRPSNTATHVEVVYRDQYLARADLWQLIVAELCNHTVFKGQTVVFLNTIKVSIRDIYVQGRRVGSALFTPSTVPIFRSESARYIYCIQMSQEMWDYDTEGSGEILFSKVVDGFFPQLFKRLQKVGPRHLISIMMFARTEYEKGVLKPPATSHPRTRHRFPDDDLDYRDHYKIVAIDRHHNDWVALLRHLKKHFRNFLRDILTVPVEQTYGKRPDRLGNVQDVEITQGHVLVGRPTSASRGNILEAINLASPWFALDHIDRDLARTGRSLIIITAGTGVFDVDYDLLKLTTEVLVSNTRAIDLVSLSPMPLHSVPLFRYRLPNRLDPLDDRTSSYTGSFTREACTPRPHITRTATSHSPLKPSLLGPHSRGSVQSEDQITYMEPRWGYAVPHWLDVSFWTADVDVSSYQDYQRAHVASSNGFGTRCRMYELQMMGLMESEMTDVTVPLLSLFSDETGHPRDAVKGKEQSSLPKETLSKRGHLFLSSSPASLNRRDSNQSTRDAVDIAARQILTSWMDQHDEQATKVKYLPRAAASPEEMYQREASQTRQRPHGPRHNVSEHDFAKRPVPSVSGKSTAGDDTSSINSRSGSTKAQDVVLPAATKTNESSGKLPRQLSMGPKGLAFLKSAATKGITTASSASVSISDASTSGAMTQQSARSSDLLARQLSSTLTRKTSQQSLTKTRSVRAESVVSDSSNAPTVPPLPPAYKNSVPSIPIAIGKDTQASDGDRAEDIAATVRAKARPAEVKVGRDAGSHVGVAESVTSIRDHIALSRRLSPIIAMSQWLTVLNPFNPASYDWMQQEQPRRWQHIFPKAAPKMRTKWRSFTSTSSYPLTNNHMPALEELEECFSEELHELSSRAYTKQSRDVLLRQVVAARLSRGFQFIVGQHAEAHCKRIGLKLVNCFDPNTTTSGGKVILMSSGNNIHQLRCIDRDKIEIKRFIRRADRDEAQKTAETCITYEAHVKTMLQPQYVRKLITFMNPRPEYDWHTIDGYLSGAIRELAPNLPYLRARFVLIPNDVPRGSRQTLSHIADATDEEVRLEGILRLTQMWQRQRIFGDADESKAYFNPLDPSPLPIDFQTADPSAVVRSYALGTVTDPILFGDQALPTFLPSDMFPLNDYDPYKVAQAMQAEPPQGVSIQDRKWHWRTHPRAFRGDELVSWLMIRFKGLESRDDAVRVGNDLMKRGLFAHVKQAHAFRDGNYFYQMQGRYKQLQPSNTRGGWFSRLTERSVPSTPNHDDLAKSISGSPLSGKYRKGQSQGDTPSSHSEKSIASKDAKTIELGRSIRFDADPRRRSWRPEALTLHYDRIHNPENCFHFRIDWINVTSKFIEDAIVSWATFAEKYGLKLVEIPIAELSKVNEHNNYRSMYTVEPAVRPTHVQPDVTSLPYGNARFVMERALLRKWDFVLDLEAARVFDVPNATVVNAYGLPDYEFTQFVHKSGKCVIQIDDDGNFLLLTNHLSGNRAALPNDLLKLDRLERDRKTGIKDNRSPLASPLVRASDAQVAAYLANAGESGSSTPTAGMISVTAGTGSNAGGSGKRTHTARHAHIASFTEQMTGKADPSPEDIFAAFLSFCQDEEALTAAYNEAALASRFLNSNHEPQSAVHHHAHHYHHGSVSSTFSSAEPSPSTSAAVPLSPRHIPINSRSFAPSSSAMPHHHHHHAYHLQHRSMSAYHTTHHLRPEADIPILGLPERSMGSYASANTAVITNSASTSNLASTPSQSGLTAKANNNSLRSDRPERSDRISLSTGSSMGLFQRALSYGLSSSTGTVIAPFATDTSAATPLATPGPSRERKASQDHVQAQTPTQPIDMAMGERSAASPVKSQLSLQTQQRQKTTENTSTVDDEAYMRLALAEARKAPASSSNFSVGAVLVSASSDPQILATGYTLELRGNTHAEQCCILKFASQHQISEPQVGQHLPDDAELYTTMEPCNARLSGNRPCVDTILACVSRTGKPAIKSVYVGVREPSSFLAVNEGETRLRNAGVRVVHVAGLEGEILAVAKAGHET